MHSSPAQPASDADGVSKDPYTLLRVPRDAGAAEVTQAYERELRAAHAAGAIPYCVDLLHAFETLSDPVKRRLFYSTGVTAERPRSRSPQDFYGVRGTWRAPSCSMLDGTPLGSEPAAVRTRTPVAPRSVAPPPPRLGFASAAGLVMLGISIGSYLASHHDAPASPTAGQVVTCVTSDGIPTFVERVPVGAQPACPSGTSPSH